MGFMQTFRVTNRMPPEEFKYRPPLKYLFIGLGGIVLFFIFGLGVIKGDEIWFSMIIGLFSLMGLGMGISFLMIFFRKFNVEKLKIGDDYIEIPRRWKDRIELNLTDIMELSDFDTYDSVIEIKSNQRIHLIERNWMKEKEFDKVKERIKDYWINKRLPKT